MSPISRIRKRDGRVVKFDQTKITEALWRAAQSVGGNDQKLAEKISNQICTVLEVFFKGEENIPTVEQIQDLVEKILIENGHAKTAKAYILYREEHHKLREQKANILGTDSDSKFSLNALKVLQQHFLLRDENGVITETPEQLFRRVAHAVAEIDKKYPESPMDAEASEHRFYELMVNKDFLPESNILMHAGTDLQPVTGEISLKLEDNLENIFETLKHSLLLYQNGGKINLDFSQLRFHGDTIASTHGTASGPVAFLKTFDTALNNLKQGHRQNRKNLAILNIDHPDILEFITSKENEKELTNFNIAININSIFMEALAKDEEYDLLNPRTQKVANRLNARNVFDLIIANNWRNHQPEIIFSDRLEESFQTQQAVPCGFLNIAHFGQNEKIQWHRLQEVIVMAVHFLDNLIDLCPSPFQTSTSSFPNERAIQLSITGLADLLIHLKISYGSEEALAISNQLIVFIEKEARNASALLAQKRGSFEGFTRNPDPASGFKTMRNSKVTGITSSKTISKILEVSNSIEALETIVSNKRTIDEIELISVHPDFEKETKNRDLYSKELMRKIAQAKSIQAIGIIPEDLKQIYKTQQDITPQQHLALQLAFEKFTHHRSRKLIHFEANTSIENIKNIYLTAYQEGVKSLIMKRAAPIETPHLKTPLITQTKPKKTLHKQISLPFIEAMDEHRLPKLQKEFSYQSIQKTSGQQKVQEVLLPPIEATENSEENMKNYLFSANFKSLNPKRCPKCKAQTQTGDGCLLCINCGFSVCIV